MPYPSVTQYNQTQAWGINNNGAIVGFYGYFENNLGHFVGFKRGPGGALQTIKYPAVQPSHGWTVIPTAILNNGTIAGYYSAAIGLTRGFILADGQFTSIDLSPVPNGATIIQGMNNRGDFVGQYQGENGSVKFVSMNGVVTQLPELVGNSQYSVQGIGADGTLVGCHEKGAYVRGPKGKHFIFRIPGAITTCARDINTAAGKIVGSYLVSETPLPKILGFVYDYASDLFPEPTTGIAPMVREVPFVSVEVPGAMETVVHGINAHGVITGVTNADGGPHTRTFIGTPVP